MAATMQGSYCQIKNVLKVRFHLKTYEAVRSYKKDVRLIQDEIMNKVQEIRKIQEEGSHQPSKLLAVWRVAPLKGRPYWEKDIMIKLGLDERNNEPGIIKNTPQNVEMVKKVNHLVRVKPITFPYGEPPRNGDYTGTYLNEKGEFIVHQSLKLDPQRTEGDPYNEKLKMDRVTVEKKERWKWMYLA